MLFEIYIIRVDKEKEYIGQGILFRVMCSFCGFRLFDDAPPAALWKDLAGGGVSWGRFLSHSSRRDSST